MLEKNLENNEDYVKIDDFTPSKGIFEMGIWIQHGLHFPK